MNKKVIFLIALCVTGSCYPTILGRLALGTRFVSGQLVNVFRSKATKVFFVENHLGKQPRVPQFRPYIFEPKKYEKRVTLVSRTCNGNLKPSDQKSVVFQHRGLLSPQCFGAGSVHNSHAVLWGLVGACVVAGIQQKNSEAEKLTDVSSQGTNTTALTAPSFEKKARKYCSFCSSLHQAIMNNDVEELRAQLKLPESKLLINSVDRQFHLTPLAYAAQQENVEIMRLLVDNGANVNGDKNGISRPLAVALMADKQQAVKFLLDRGAYIALEDLDCSSKAMHKELTVEMERRKKLKEIQDVDVFFSIIPGV